MQFKSKKHKVIEILKKQHNKLGTLKSTDAYAWKAHTAEIIKKYLGAETKFLHEFTGAYSAFYDLANFNRDKESLRIRLENCIEFIELNGLNEKKSNFMQNIGDEAMAAYLIGAITVIGGAGYFCGNYFTQNKLDSTKLKLESKIDSLENQNRNLLLKLTNFNPNVKKDTTDYSKTQSK